MCHETQTLCTRVGSSLRGGRHDREFQVKVSSQTGNTARDPGVRAGAPGAGGALAGLTGQQNEYFVAGKEDFEEAEEVDEGMGPRMNLDSCGGCHSQPSIGGTSPAMNPQVAFASQDGGTDTVPSFITLNGPVREARFISNRDGSRTAASTRCSPITGRPGAAGCTLAQPDFAAEIADAQRDLPDSDAGVRRRPDGADPGLGDPRQPGQPTPRRRARSGIRGRANFAVSGRTITGQTNSNGNDGTIARFGWKAQNKSLLLFSGEAYNVEMGITNELFQTERDETAACQFAADAQQHHRHRRGDARSRRDELDREVRVLHAPARAAGRLASIRPAAPHRSRAAQTLFTFGRMRASVTRRRSGPAIRRGPRARATSRSISFPIC